MVGEEEKEGRKGRRERERRRRREREKERERERERGDRWRNAVQVYTPWTPSLNLLLWTLHQ